MIANGGIKRLFCKTLHPYDPYDQWLTSDIVLQGTIMLCPQHL
jgi:hypothetical protein